MPTFAVKDALAEGRLQSLLDTYIRHMTLAKFCQTD